MKKINFQFQQPCKLRYGENPHQKAWVWQAKTSDSLALFKFKQIQGKELSFNNFLDINAAVKAISFIGQKKPSCIVIKHTNPCGASRHKDIKKAFFKAWQGDSLAAFGSIIAVNRAVSEQLAKIMLSENRFFEVLLCPKINFAARKFFQTKPNLRVLTNPGLAKPKLVKSLDFRQIRGGLLVQEADIYQLKNQDLKIVTRKKPTRKQLTDLKFAWKIAQVSKANSIVLAKNQQLISSGVGQQDRLRCCQLAAAKAGQRSKNTVVASDAFFPFKDGPETLIKAGVKAIIQPGGSIRDQETIDLCNRQNIPMVFTGIRCFYH